MDDDDETVPSVAIRAPKACFVQPRARVVVLSGAQRGESYRVHRSLTIGRSRDADVTLSGRRLSREHARIVPEGGHYVLEDRSSNGCAINGQPAPPRARLNFGDEIDLAGEAILLFTHEHEERAQLQQLERFETIGRVAASIAHDFNNVLAVVLATLEALDVDGVDRDALEDARAATHQGIALSRQIVDLARPHGEERYGDLGAVAQSTAKLMQRLLRLSDDHIRVRVEASQGVVVRCPTVQLQQVAMNLCVNAKEAMAETGGTLAVSVDAPSPGWARLTVSDAGRGMQPQTASRAFEPFFTGRAQGTGLGLATVAEIVEGAGGHCHVRTAAGHGTTVEAWLPRAEVPREAPNASAPIADEGALEEGRAPKVLVLEDDHALGRAMKRQLARVKVPATWTAAPEVALERLEAEPFDAVLVDLHLEETTALELLPELRARAPDAKFVIYSGGWTEQQRAALLAGGAHALLQKPCTAQELLAALLAGED